VTVGPRDNGAEDDPFAIPSGVTPDSHPVRPPQPSAMPPAGWSPAVPYRYPTAAPAPAYAAPALVYAPAFAPPAPQGSQHRRGTPEHDEAQPFHRILRTRNYRWWRPLVGLAVMAVTFIGISLVVTMAALLPALFSGALDLESPESDPTAALVSSPIGLLGVNLSLAALIPAAILGLLAGHQLRPGWLHSVVGRMRWKFLFLCLLIEVAVSAAILPLSAIAGAASGTEAVETDPLSFAAWLPFAIVILLTTPLQAAGEEYGFRGYGLQALGAWVRNPWFGIVVTSLLFAAAHGGQSLPLFLNRFAFGMVAGYLTVRTGGLEAAISIHVVNNLVVLLLASATGQLEPSLTVSEAPWAVSIVDVAGMLLYALFAVRLANRMGLDRVTAVSPPRPPMAAPYPPSFPPSGQAHWGTPGGFGPTQSPR
jgi:membrane protease YdiL (CAAX protease family)